MFGVVIDMLDPIVPAVILSAFIENAEIKSATTASADRVPVFITPPSIVVVFVVLFIFETIAALSKLVDGNAASGIAFAASAPVFAVAAFADLYSSSCKQKWLSMPIWETNSHDRHKKEH